MNWRIGRWWLAGLLAYLIFLLATYPAIYAIGWLQHRLPGVQLGSVSGSIWSGTAQEFGLEGQSWGVLNWHFDWRAPFTGQLGYRLRLEDSETALQGRVVGRFDRLTLEDLQGHIPISRVEPWLPIPRGSVSGDLDLQLKRVVLIKMLPTSADGSVNLTGVSLSWPEELVLGDYQLKLQTQGQKGIQGSFTDTGGPLILQGVLTLTPDGHYQINGTLMSRDPANQALTGMLHYLPDDGAGHHPFNFTGRL
jgi:general secretion pathway protein N